MRNWKHTIKFDHFWKDEDMSMSEKGKKAAESIKLIQRHFKDDLDLEIIIENFEDVSGDGEPLETSEFTITQDFDARMSELYDWADCNDVWVKTSF